MLLPLRCAVRSHHYQQRSWLNTLKPLSLPLVMPWAQKKDVEIPQSTAAPCRDAMNTLKLLQKTGLIPTWKPAQSPELTSKCSSSRARMLGWARGQQGSLAGLIQSFGLGLCVPRPPLPCSQSLPLHMGESWGTLRTSKLSPAVAVGLLLSAGT